MTGLGGIKALERTQCRMPMNGQIIMSQSRWALMGFSISARHLFRAYPLTRRWTAAVLPHWVNNIQDMQLTNRHVRDVRGPTGSSRPASDGALPEFDIVLISVWARPPYVTWLFVTTVAFANC